MEPNLKAAPAGNGYCWYDGKKPTQRASMYPFIAVDIGNSAIKLANFAANDGQPLPQPAGVEVCEQIDDVVLKRLDSAPVRWWIASVHREKELKVIRAIENARPQDQIETLSHNDANLELDVLHPDQLGEDRIFAAVAVNAIRKPNRSAMVVDTGSAITIDAINPAGRFTGGAILPGLAMSARALHRDTDALPEVFLGDVPPEVIGNETTSAIQSGIVHGAAGAIRYFAASLQHDSSTPPLCVISGGDAHRLMPLLGAEWLHLPHLVVQGVAITAMRRQS